MTRPGTVRDMPAILLMIASVIVGVFGIIDLLNGAILWGVLLVVLAVILWPGTVFNRRV